LTGLPDNQRAVLRPLLVRPLLQSYAAIIRPASEELNKTWRPRSEPFNRKLAIKYPFTAQSNIEAAPAEISQMFGLRRHSKYVETAMGLWSCAGAIPSRHEPGASWALQPEFMTDFARWVSPLEGGAAADASGGGTGGGGQAQTAFMLRPRPRRERPATSSRSMVRNWLSQRRGAVGEFCLAECIRGTGGQDHRYHLRGKIVDVVNIPGRFGLEK
jgi:type VI secretion system protein ImpL